MSDAPDAYVPSYYLAAAMLTITPNLTTCVKAREEWEPITPEILDGKPSPAKERIKADLARLRALCDEFEADARRTAELEEGSHGAGDSTPTRIAEAERGPAAQDSGPLTRLENQSSRRATAGSSRAARWAGR